MDNYEVIAGIAVGLLLIGGLLYRAIARLLKSQTVTPGELEAVRDERDRLAAELERVRAEANAASAANGKLEGLLEAAKFTVKEKSSHIDGLETKLEEVRAEAAKAKNALTELQANSNHMQAAYEETKAFVDDAKVKLSGAFAELAGKAFEDKGQLFEKNVKNVTAQSKADIDLLLKPFADRLKDFRDRVDVIYQNEARERQTLTGAVNELKTLNHEMATQAAALTRALKGSSKVRGDWGELMLETVLRCSGLEEGVHYERQQSKTDDEGERLRPDIIVRLPDDRKVVVDSKVNLVAWIEAMNAESPDAYDAALKRHAAALRQHVKDLAEKNYPKSLGAGTLETTIAFVPIEGAMSAALGSDGALQAYAFEQRVVFASPNTLMAMLRIVDQLWTREKIQRQAIEIGEAGGKVLDAMTRFLQEFDRIGVRLNGAHEAFTDARKFLSESSQAVLPRVRRLAELGVKGKKALHADLQPDVIGSIEAAELGQELLEGPTADAPELN